MKISEELADRLGEEVTRIMDLFGSQIRSEVPSLPPREKTGPLLFFLDRELASGVNVNHVGRVFVAAMGKSMGIPVEMTCSFFEVRQIMIPRRPRTKSVMCMSANTLPMVARLSN